MKPSVTWVILSIAFLAVCCEGLSHWGNAESFRSELRCGMSEERVNDLARELGASSVKSSPSNSFGDHVVDKGGTVFWLRFSGGGLQSVRQGQHFGITGLRTSAMQNLCNGEKTTEVTVQIIGPRELSGAELSVDGRRWGVIGDPSDGVMIHNMPGGNHELVISKVGYASIRKSYDHTGKNYWQDDSPVRVTISRDELVHG